MLGGGGVGFDYLGGGGKVQKIGGGQRLRGANFLLAVNLHFLH